MKQIVCNASPLITLAKGGLLNALPDQFGKIICPQAVVDEILAGPPEDVMRRVLPDLSWLERVRLDPHGRKGINPQTGEADDAASRKGSDIQMLWCSANCNEREGWLRDTKFGKRTNLINAWR